MNDQIKISDWINHLLSIGKYSFSLSYLHDSMPHKSNNSIKMALKRLVDKNKIISIYKGFYIIIPPSYANLGLLPPTMFMNDLMNYLDRPYYISLLSAAALQGAAHQQPQIYFVCTSLPSIRDTNKRGMQIKYVSKRNFPKVHLIKKNTESGYVSLSDPLLTCMDLINYHKTIGGLNRASTVINELSEEISKHDISADILQLGSYADMQRLGYLWEYECDQEELANALFKILKESLGTLKPYKLNPSKKLQEQKKTNRWKISVNTKIEIDQ